MKIAGLGHIALKVSNMEKSKAFYHGVLGMPYSGEHEDKLRAFFRADAHHNLALFLTDVVESTNTSLDHVAFKLEGGKQELERAKVELQSAGIKVTPYSHREVESLYLNDPDGNQIELYVHSPMSVE